MFRSTKFKGQWYMISLVILSFILLTFFYIIHSYSSIDFNSVIETQEDTIYLNIVSGIRYINETSDCKNLKMDIEDFISNLKIFEKYGYLVDYDIDVISCDIYIDKLIVGDDKMLIKKI
ncbi:MAG: hypothetical protein B6U88_02010 [Candidatus Aenigmarchaeota archaeon ex4484_56]|nr:MAG: hypothetical protein B6U88_02010 [Candidatus Aenigmarchaeota archaeon ex4484_56]